MENLIEITPEIKEKALELLKLGEELRGLLAKFGSTHAELDISYNPNNHYVTIFDRHERSKQHKDLGFYVHHIYTNGKHDIDFIAEDFKEAKEFQKKFREEQDNENR